MRPNEFVNPVNPVNTESHEYQIAHSPDSDDAFMFYGLASGRVPSNGFELEHVLSDIETLNRAAFEGSTRSPRCRFTPTRT